MIDLTLERYRGLLRRGSVPVNPADPGKDIRLLFNLERAVQDGKTLPSGVRKVISRQMQFVQIDAQGRARPDLTPHEQEQLTRYATVTRYPGDYEAIPLAEARSAVKIARRVRGRIRKRLPK